MRIKLAKKLIKLSRICAPKTTNGFILNDFSNWECDTKTGVLICRVEMIKIHGRRPPSRNK